MNAQQRAHRRRAIAPGLLDPGHGTSTDDPFGLGPLFGGGVDSSTTTTTQTTNSQTQTVSFLNLTSTSTTSSTTSTTTSSTPTSTSTSTSTSVVPSSTLTISITLSPSNTAVRAPASSVSVSASPTGASNTGKIVGGILAAIVAIVLLFVIAAFFLRRMRRRRSLEAEFDPASFRASAMVVPDTPSQGAGFNPRPPMTMSDSRAATLAQHYGAPTNLFVAPVVPSYTQSPFSPTESDPFKPPVLTRIQSTGSYQSSTYASQHSTPPAVDYVQLSRSPSFARAQYVTIPKKDAPVEPAPPPVPEKDLPSPRLSAGSRTNELAHGLDDFPVPPPPSSASPSRYGVPYTPPVLPEISFRNSGLSSPALTSQFPSGVSDVAAVQPVTMERATRVMSSSPMASSFVLTPKPDENSFKEQLTVPPTAHTEPPKRPETVYDMNDAYGGI